MEKRKVEIVSKRKPKGSQAVSKAQVKSMIDSALKSVMELKYYTASDSATSISFSGFIASISNPSQGDTDTTRDGDRLNIKLIRFRYGITNGDNVNFVRVILFQWHPSSAQYVPTVGDILSSVGSVLSPFSPYVIDNEKQYTILYDKTIAINAYYNGGTKCWTPENEVVIRTGFIPLQVFSAGTQFGTNQIWKICISDSGAAPNPTITSWSQVRFTDA
jgi:hypothetical protein